MKPALQHWGRNNYGIIRHELGILTMNYRFIIIGILFGGFIIIGSSVYIGYALRDGDVVDNAYEAGLRFDEQARKRQELGWVLELPRTVLRQKEGPTAVKIYLKDRTGAVLRDATVQIDMNRMGSRIVSSYRCAAGGDGGYETEMHLDATGYWEARVRADRFGDSLVFDDQFNVMN
jgi:nitrogen fixation protein FixH